MGRNPFIDFLKGFLIVLVCVGHSVQYVFDRENFYENWLFKIIYMFHMPLFAAVSGYLYGALLQSGNRAGYLARKLATFALPVVIWAVILRCTGVAMPSGPGADRPPSATLAGSLLNLWFLWALMGSLCLAVAAQEAGRFRVLAAAALFAALLCLPDRANLHYVKYLFPYFYAAFLLVGVDPAALAGLARSRWFMTAAGLCALLCFSFWTRDTYVYTTKMALTPDNLPNVGLRWFGGFAASALVLAVLGRAYARSPQGLRAALARYGKDSIYVYVLQTYAFSTFLHRGLGLTGRWPGAAADAASVAFGCAVAAACLSAGGLLGRGAAGLLLFGKGQFTIIRTHVNLTPRRVRP